MAGQDKSVQPREIIDSPSAFCTVPSNSDDPKTEAKSKYDEYMSKAEYAQRQSEKSKDQKAQNARITIAGKYRDLAMLALHSHRKRGN